MTATRDQHARHDEELPESAQARTEKGNVTEERKGGGRVGEGQHRMSRREKGDTCSKHQLGTHTDTGRHDRRAEKQTKMRPERKLSQCHEKMKKGGERAFDGDKNGTSPRDGEMRRPVGFRPACAPALVCMPPSLYLALRGCEIGSGALGER